MTDTPKRQNPCPDGDACPDARRYGAVHPAPVSPATDKGLDFEKALRGPEFDRWIDRDELNRQHLAALEGVRKEERAKVLREVASAWAVYGPSRNNRLFVEWLAKRTLGQGATE